MTVEKENKYVVFKMAHNKSRGPDEFITEFYQHYWEIVKGDIMRLFEAMYEGTLDVQRLNYGVITLIPKINGANKIQ